MDPIDVTCVMTLDNSLPVQFSTNLSVNKPQEHLGKNDMLDRYSHN